ncbi:3'(2'),5'-bisphosphate nucleotidase CysQ [Pilimelia columellifera subsp. columellifera]|uniref:3'(2'),5'-bisphosphate nucleotidase CysQ n=1 Tax=Pilimelia columellifera subsp. columellifera TaxID=706583 RepID=A0ABN3NB07_9ACTN
MAGRAGALLLALRASDERDDPPALRATGDRAAHELLVAELGRRRPGDAVLSEEDAGSRVADGAAARLGAERVWIVDPLDGTREYGEPGRVDWAVHVALWRRGEPPHARPGVAASAPAGGELIAGAVALPAQERLLGVAEVVPAPTSGPLRLAVSRTRPPAFVPGLLAAVGGVPVPMGSAGAKVCAVVTGEVDAYVHTGGQYEWDSAAPVAVARAAGLHTSRVDGSPLRYNQADPRLPDLLVCRREHSATLLAALATFIAAETSGKAMA